MAARGEVDVPCHRRSHVEQLEVVSEAVCAVVQHERMLSKELCCRQASSALWKLDCDSLEAFPLIEPP